MDFSLALVDAPSFKRGEETTHEEKVRLFALVKNRNDWKLPVHKIITVQDGDDVPRIADAVMFFCGGMARQRLSVNPFAALASGLLVLVTTKI